MDYTFIYSTEFDGINQKEITVNATNDADAYVIFIRGLLQLATFVINKTTGKRII